ncbi:MAG: hypothetical protein RR603_03705 [Kurthia sp.]
MGMMLRRYHDVTEEALVEDEKAVNEQNTIDQQVDFNSLKVDELKLLLDEREIAYTNEMLKADLVALLEGEADATN